jgi:hypothetical protein
MVTQRSAIIGLLSLIALPFALLAACDKVPLLAPTGTVISLIPVTTSGVSLNSEVTIIATVIENGTASAGAGSGSGTVTTSRAGAGTPVQNGTLISFTTTIGHIEPSEARTHNGQVSVKLITGGASGKATITAFSGGASASTTLNVGTFAVNNVLVTTIPTSLPAAGGSVQVVASVHDDGDNPLSGVPVTFVTDNGSVSPSTATTDASGNATTTLTTSATAKVTAVVGTVTATATVTVNPRALSGFTASPSATSVGTPVTFTVTPTTGVNLSNVHIDFGDGDSTDLGTATSTQHAYRSSGNFTARATATDVSGQAQSLTTLVIVGSLQLTISASSSTPTVNTPVTFTVSGQPAQVDHFEWTIDDGTLQRTTSPSLQHAFATKGPKNIRVDVFGVGGALIGSATLQIVVN